MTEKYLGKIVRAEYGTMKEYPFLFGLQLSFALDGSVVSDGGKYTTNIEIVHVTGRELVVNDLMVHTLLKQAKVNYVSQLVGIPVEIAIENNTFEDFRILTEVL